MNYIVLSLIHTSLHSAFPRILHYFAKVIFQTVNLLWVIFVHTKKPSHVLVQVSNEMFCVGATAGAHVVSMFATLVLIGGPHCKGASMCNVCA